MAIDSCSTSALVEGPTCCAVSHATPERRSLVLLLLLVYHGRYSLCHALIYSLPSFLSFEGREAGLGASATDAIYLLLGGPVMSCFDISRKKTLLLDR